MILPLGYLLLICAFVFSSIDNVYAADTMQADKIFLQFERGEIVHLKEAQIELAHLTQLVSNDDTNRTEKLQQLQCWHQAASNATEISQALQNATLQLNTTAITASASHILNLTLCQAWFFRLNGDIEQAMAGFDNSVKLAYEQEDLKLIADSHSLRGALYSFVGDFPAALNDLIAAQDLYESLELTVWATINLIDIAASYRRSGDPENALKYSEKLKQVYLSNGDMLLAMLVYAETALTLEEMGEYQQALEHLLMSHDYYKENNLDNSAAVTSINIAANLLKLDRQAEAEHYLQQAAMVITPGDKTNYSFMKLFIAEYHYKQEQYDEALNQLEEAEKIFDLIKNDRGLMLAFQLKSNIFAAIENWQLAYLTSLQRIDLIKKLNLHGQSAQVSEMRVKFNTQRIEMENRRLIELQHLKEQELALLSKNKWLQYQILLLTSLFLVLISLFAYKQVQKNHLLKVLAMTDHLTKLANRRRIYDLGKRYFKNALKHEQFFSVIIFDADRFKKINDQFGHDIGDIALIALAKACKNLPIPTKTIGRIGGEEFLILLPNTDTERATELAKQLQTQISIISQQELPSALILTISIGIATLVPDNAAIETSEQPQAENFARLLKCADTALYAAKHAGRNCIKVADSL
ncbi:MAG: diguanylate cyclase [Shewanella sp.]